jgi:hypothetical protein
MAKTYNDDEEQFGGFGREAVEKAAKRPTYASTQGQVGERERREAEVAGPLKAPKKRIVTKEQMKKEGFDNLRDYLNSSKVRNGVKQLLQKPHQSLVNLLVVPKMKVMLVKLRLVQLKKLK